MNKSPKAFLTQYLELQRDIDHCFCGFEKARRIRRQAVFLQNVLCERRRNFENCKKIAASNNSAKALMQPTRDEFLAIGFAGIFEEQDIVSREFDSLLSYLEKFNNHEMRTRQLEAERNRFFETHSALLSKKLRKGFSSYERLERRWSVLSEDLININGAIIFLNKNNDYLRSCHNHLVLANSIYPDDLMRYGLDYFFRLTEVGRAKDMAQCADCNCLLARKELACLSDYSVYNSAPWIVMTHLLHAMYDDIFVNQILRLESSLRLIKAIIAANRKFLNELQDKSLCYSRKFATFKCERSKICLKLGIKCHNYGMKK